MDSNDLPRSERIQHLWRSSLRDSDELSSKIECYDIVATPNLQLQNMQASANEIGSLTKGLLGASERQPGSFSLFPRSEEAETAVQSMVVNERSWRELTGPSSFTSLKNLEKYTLVAHESFDICWEWWRKPDADLCFVDLDDDKAIYNRHWSVESMMQAESAYYDWHWELPVIEAKFVVREVRSAAKIN